MIDRRADLATMVGPWAPRGARQDSSSKNTFYHVGAPASTMVGVAEFFLLRRVFQAHSGPTMLTVRRSLAIMVGQSGPSRKSCYHGGPFGPQAVHHGSPSKKYRCHGGPLRSIMTARRKNRATKVRTLWTRRAHHDGKTLQKSCYHGGPIRLP